MFLSHWRLKSKIAMYFTEHPYEVIGAGELANRLNRRAADVAEVLLKMYDAGLLVAEHPAGEVLFSLNPDHPVVAGPVDSGIMKWPTLAVCFGPPLDRANS